MPFEEGAGAFLPQPTNPKGFLPSKRPNRAPESATTPSKPPKAKIPEPAPYVVQPGESRASIAAKNYSDPALYRALIAYQRDQQGIVGALQPGQQIALPSEALLRSYAAQDPALSQELKSTLRSAPAPSPSEAPSSRSLGLAWLDYYDRKMAREQSQGKLLDTKGPGGYDVRQVQAGFGLDRKGDYSSSPEVRKEWATISQDPLETFTAALYKGYDPQQIQAASGQAGKILNLTQGTLDMTPGLSRLLSPALEDSFKYGVGLAKALQDDGLAGGGIYVLNYLGHAIDQWALGKDTTGFSARQVGALYMDMAENVPDELKAIPTWARVPALALGYVWANYGLQAYTQISKVPERLLYLEDLYSNLLTPIDPSNAYFISVTPMLARLPQEEQTKILIEEQARKTYQRKSFEEFIGLTPGDYSIESLKQINWDRVVGHFNPDPLARLDEVMMGNYGITGLGFTFIGDSKAQDEFIKAAEDAAASGDRPFWEVVNEHQNLWKEFVFGTLTDPAWFLPGDVIKALFPISFVLEPVLGRVVGVWSREAALAKSYFGVGKAAEEAPTKVGKIWSYLETIFNLSKRSIFTAYSDANHNMLVNLAVRHDPAIHGRPYFVEGGWVQDILRDPSIVKNLLTEREYGVLQAAVRRLNEADLGNLGTLLKKAGALKRLEQVGGDGTVSRMLDVLGGGDSPANVLGYVARALDDLERRRLGQAFIPSGTLARSMDWIGSLLKENWLGPSMHFHGINMVGDTGRIVAAGYLPPAYERGSAEKLAEYLGEEYGVGLPAEVARVLIADSLDVGSRPLATSQIPIPFIGNQNAVTAVWNNFVGGKPPASVTNFLEGNSVFAWTLRNINWAKVVEKGLDFGTFMESSRRTSIFFQAFEGDFEGKQRPLILQALANDPNVPDQVLYAYAGRRIKKPGDWDKVAASALAEGGPAEHFDFNRPGTVPDNDFTNQLGEQLAGVQETFDGNYDNPLFTRQVDGLFNRAERASLKEKQDAVNAILETTDLPEEALARMQRQNRIDLMTGGSGTFTLGDITLYAGDAATEYLSTSPRRFTGVFQDGTWLLGDGMHFHTRQAAAELFGVTTEDQVTLLLVNSSYMGHPHIDYEFSGPPGAIQDAAAGLLSHGQDPSTIIAVTDPAAPETITVHTLQELAGDSSLLGGAFLGAQKPEGFGRLPGMTDPREVVSNAFLYDPAYTERQLIKAKSGLMPDNAIFQELFRQAETPEQLTEMANTYFDQGPAGIRQAYEDALDAYGAAYYGPEGGPRVAEMLPPAPKVPTIEGSQPVAPEDILAPSSRTILKGIYAERQGWTFSGGLDLMHAEIASRAGWSYPDVVAEFTSWDAVSDVATIFIYPEANQENVFLWLQNMGADPSGLLAVERATTLTGVPLPRSDRMGEAETKTLAEWLGEEKLPPTTTKTITTPAGAEVPLGTGPTNVLESVPQSGDRQASLGPIAAPDLTAPLQGLENIKGILVRDRNTMQPTWLWARNHIGEGTLEIHHGLLAEEFGYKSEDILAFYTNEGGKIQLDAKAATNEEIVGSLMRQGLDPTIEAPYVLPGGGGVQHTSLSEWLGDWMDAPAIVGSGTVAPPPATQMPAPATAQPRRTINIISKPKGVRWGRFKAAVEMTTLPEEGTVGVYDPVSNQLVWDEELPSHQPSKALLGVPAVGGSVDFMIRSPDGLVAAAPTFEDAQAFARHLIEDLGISPKSPLTISLLKEQEVLEGHTVGSLLDVAHVEDNYAEVHKQAQESWRASMLQKVNDEYAKLTQGLTDWRAKVKDIAARNARVQARTEAERARAQAVIDQYKAQHLQALEDSTLYAVSEVNRILFDYAIKTNAEELLRYYSPFTTWQLRDPLFWAQMFAKRPNLLGVAYKAWYTMEQDRKRKNLTARFQGTLGANLPATPVTPAGYYGLDVTSLADFMGVNRTPFEPPNYQPPAEDWKQLIAKLIHSGQFAGVSPWPWLDWGAQAVGALPKTGIGEVLGIGQRLVDLALRMGGVQSPAGTSESSQFLFEYNTKRRISEMEAEGLITHTESLEALATHEGPAWQEATDFVTKVSNILNAVSLFTPGRIKYSSPGEQRIRDTRAQAGASYDAYPFLSTYGLVFQDQKAAERALIYDQYAELIDRAVPGSTEYSNAIRDRSNALKQAGFLSDVKASYFYRGTQLLKQDGPLYTQWEQSDLLHSLNDMKPSVSDFTDQRTQAIDWEAYHQALDLFNTNVPKLSQQLGIPISEDEWVSYQDRYKSALQTAYDVHREKIDAAWTDYESYLPGGSNFMKTVSEYSQQVYKDAVAAGMHPDDAAKYAKEKWDEAIANGLPYDVAVDKVAPWVTRIDADQYEAEVTKRLGLDWKDYAVRANLRFQLENATFPGMFGEAAKQQMYDYYFNQTPPDQRLIREFVDVPEGKSFTQWFGGLSPTEQEQLWKRVRVRSLQPLMTINAGMIMPGSDFWLPPNDALTDQEKADLAQLDRDWFEYTQRTAAGKGASWTPLMEKYSGDPNSGSSQFWAALGGWSITTKIYDDPVLGPIMDGIARHTLKFTDEQYRVATQYFRDHLSEFVDVKRTQELRSHPDWVEQAQKERDALSATRTTAMEDAKSNYYNIPFEPYGKPRKAWQVTHPTEWAQLSAYITYQKAEQVGRPYYLWVYNPDKYRWYYGGTPPDKLGTLPARLRGDMLDALSAYTAWLHGEGPWTPNMETFYGPDPTVVEETKPESKKSSGGSSSGGGGGGGGGDDTLPPPPPPPAP